MRLKISYKQIERIKTALSDGSCESVDVGYCHVEGDLGLKFECLLPDDFNHILASFPELLTLKSIKYNRHTYADLEAGDTVNAPDSTRGDGVINGIDSVSREPFEVIHFKSGAVEYYERHELILLEKRNDK